MQNWNRPEKGKARSFMMQFEDNNKGAKLMLVAEGLFDVKEGLFNGTLTRKDYIIAVNKDEKICKEAEKFLNKRFDNYKVVNEYIQDMNLLKY